MSRRHIYIGIAGLLLGFIGLAALWFPVYLNQYDAYGIKISCGNGIGFQLAQISHDANAPTSGCGSALLIRRAWAIPTVALGWLLVTWVAITWIHGGQQTDDEPEHLVPHPEIA